MKKETALQRFVLASVLAALIIVFTLIPFTGYITYGPVEITTLHIIVILGAACLGWKYGALLGGVWGVTCLLRAFTNPAWLLFTNPLISVLPRIAVGLIAGLVCAGLSKTKLPRSVVVIFTAVIGTLTNTVLVLTSLYAFGGMIESYRAFFELFKTILGTIIGINGGIELAAAVVLVPVIDRALQSVRRAYV